MSRHKDHTHVALPLSEECSVVIGDSVEVDVAMALDLVAVMVTEGDVENVAYVPPAQARRLRKALKLAIREIEGGE